MQMRLSAAIAWRYLWKKKSHGAVSAIAAVSVVGVAVATAAIVCVFSVFNGFREVLTDNNNRLLPDVEVTPVSGKVISDGDSLAAAIGHLEGVAVSTPVVADQALAIYSGHEMPVMLRGIVPSEFSRVSEIDSLVIAGGRMPADALDYDPPAALMSVGAGMRLRAYSAGDVIFLFAPRREGRINIANPISSFFTDSVSVAGVFESYQSDYDANTLFVPIEVARGLFQYDSQATSVAVRGVRGMSPGRLAEIVKESVGDRYIVRDRVRQQEVSFRMVRIEKWVTGLLLVFILVIASFNIISTMTIFVLEKRSSMHTLLALGMRPKGIGSVFAWESMYITLLGALSGIVVGVALCLLQQKYGLISMSGDEASMLVKAYPVKLQISDLPVVLVPVLLIGAFTSWIASSFARSRISEKRQ